VTNPCRTGTAEDHRFKRRRRHLAVSTPALFLVRPPDAMVPLAQGLLPLAQLQERVIGAALEAGWISEGEYARTRPATADLLLDARERHARASRGPCGPEVGPG
jgi:F plasmid transfer operon protein